MQSVESGTGAPVYILNVNGQKASPLDVAVPGLALVVGGKVVERALLQLTQQRVEHAIGVLEAAHLSHGRTVTGTQAEEELRRACTRGHGCLCGIPIEIYT